MCSFVGCCVASGNVLDSNDVGNIPLVHSVFALLPPPEPVHPTPKNSTFLPWSLDAVHHQVQALEGVPGLRGPISVAGEVVTPSVHACTAWGRGNHAVYRFVLTVANSKKVFKIELHK